MSEITSELNMILTDYERHAREPQMVLAVIAGLARQVEEDLGALPACLEKIGQEAWSWELGQRRDLDALETIAGLVHRQ